MKRLRIVLMQQCGYPASYFEPKDTVIQIENPISPDLIEASNELTESLRTLAEKARQDLLRRLVIAPYAGRQSTILAANAYAYRTHVTPIVPGSQTANPTAIFVTNLAPFVAGGTAWTNPNNAMIEDAAVATNTVPMGAWSIAITGRTFGFTIPAGATIDGVTLRTKHNITAGIAGNDGVTAIYDGSAWSADNTAGNPWIPGALAWYTTGGPADLWGMALTPAMVNGDFRVGIQVVQGGGPVPIILGLDCIELTVNYS